MSGPSAAGSHARLSAALSDAVDRALARATSERWADRLWSRDTTLWTSDSHVAGLIANRLGWLDVPTRFHDDVEELQAFAAGLIEVGFTNAVVCGMGGSSLAPEVLATVLGRAPTGIELSVLDSTDPATVRSVGEASDPASTLYLIASKSGTTTESQAFLAHFWQIEEELRERVPDREAGDHFAAITDPGASLEAIRHSDLFREIFLNPADVGGRYSALTYVGLVPAALLGLDVRALLDEAASMAAACQAPSADNPGLWLGCALGALAQAGRGKLTLVIEPPSASLGAWIEQLIAESTGKQGVGIVPVDGEELGTPDVYDDDRLFVRLSSGADAAWQATSDARLDALVKAGHPVLDLDLGTGSGALGAEFFRWEFATAVAGAVLGINPFDEPNVTESKQNTRRVLDGFRHDGRLPPREPTASEGPLTLYGDSPLRLTAGRNDVVDQLRRHLARSRTGGYIALQAYIGPTAKRDAVLRSAATMLRGATRRAVTVGYGPRFLHSTGQLHKGGPPVGCFIQLTAGHPDDLPIPGWHETFGTLIDAQAAGDFMALEAHDLPVLTIDLSADADAGLAALKDVLAQALASPAPSDSTN
jgi:transaldolase/glucose-6-phosphate isomerase